MKAFYATLSLCGLAGALSFNSAFATQGKYRAYGQAGCGFGAYVIKEDSHLQIFAATTNGIAGNQTFGISFDVSNCVPSGETVALEQQVFVEANFQTLMTESASGNGETLDAFAELLGCESQDFGNFSKSNHSQLFESKEPAQVLNTYRNLLGSKCARSS